MTPEEAYEEALRRIRKAEETGAVELDLGRLDTSTSARVGTPYLAPIALPHGGQLSDLSPPLSHLNGKCFFDVETP